MARTETIQAQAGDAAELVDALSGAVSKLDHFPFSIGRSPACNLHLPQPFVSRRHAEITRKGKRFLLSDAGSRYGTYINGERMTHHLLNASDNIQFGSLEAPSLRFEGGAMYPAAQPDILAQLKGLNTGKTDLERLRWFLEAAHNLNSSGKVDRVLASLLQATLALTEMERGYVFLSTDDRGLELALGTEADGAVLKDTATISQTVIRQAAEGIDQFIVTDTLSADGEALPESIVAQNIRSIICIPLRQPCRKEEWQGEHRLLGLLYLDSRFHAGRFSEIDHELLRTIAREAAALVENAQFVILEEQARVYHRELEIAASIQQGLMAVKIPSLPFAKVEAHSFACSAVGGDFFDVVPGEGSLSVVLVDVSGKGMSAAILASTLQGMLYMQLKAGQPFRVIAATTNAYLCTKNVGKYATMLLLRLSEGGLLEYMNCGHIQPRICSGDAVVRLEVSNLPVGLLEDATYDAASIQLDRGSRVILVSDGLTEAEDVHGESFGEERLDQAARSSDLEGMLQHMRNFCNTHPATDDCTIVQIAYRGLGTTQA